MAGGRCEYLNVVRPVGPFGADSGHGAAAVVVSDAHLGAYVVLAFDSDMADQPGGKTAVAADLNEGDHKATLSGALVEHREVTGTGARLLEPARGAFETSSVVQQDRQRTRHLTLRMITVTDLTRPAKLGRS